MSGWLRFALYAVALLAITAAGLQVYSVLPAAFAVRPVGLPADTHAVVLLFHGSGGRDEPGLIQLEDAVRRSEPAGSRTAVVRYVWSPWSDTKLRTYPNGIRVGDALGTELAGLPDLASIHLIAHSAGAYVLEPLCRAYRAQRTTPGARIRMTYLDPIGFRGPLDPGWGARQFGRCADDAEAFINTDDPVPATGAVLQHARTTDVTRDPGRRNFAGGGHRWPVQYYAGHLAPDR
ncbi:MAG: hypothetical protein ABIX37_00525 [Gammaproteobacteria bacterium]